MTAIKTQLASWPAVLDVSLLCLEDGLVRFNHVERRPNGTFRIYFDCVPSFTNSKRLKTKTLRNVVFTFHPSQGGCLPDGADKIQCSTSLESLDEDINLIGSELLQIGDNRSDMSEHRLSLVGTKIGGRQICSVTITGKLTVSQLAGNQFTADCVKHKHARGLSEGQKYWTRVVHTVIEESFPHTRRLLMGES